MAEETVESLRALLRLETARAEEGTKAWEEAEILIDRWRDWIAEERDRHAHHGKGGQQAGSRPPRLAISALIEMEREIKHHPGNARYTMEQFQKLESDLAAERAARVAAEAERDRPRGEAVSEYTPGCACAPPHTDGDQCACPCHEPDPVERTLAIVSGRVYGHKSKTSLEADLERALTFTLASLHAGGGSPVAERNRLLHLAALCVKKVTKDDAAREVAR